MEEGVVELFLVPILLIFMFIDFLNGKMEYWFRLGIPGPKPTIVFGNIGDIILQKKSFTEKVEEFYKIWISEPYFGIFSWQTPILIINDVNVIRNILVDNSKLFNSPELIIDQGIDRNSINNSKILEKKLTSVEFKNMFDSMIECTSNQLYDSNLQEIIKKNGIINCFKFAENFTSDVMRFCVFGVDENDFLRENCELKDLFSFNKSVGCQKKLNMIFGDIFDFLKGEKLLNQWKIFECLIREKIKSREKRKMCRPDFLGILKDLKDKNGDDKNGCEWNDSSIAAQIFLFIISGYDSSSSLISAALYELAVNIEVQERLRTEIIETLRICSGELSFDIVSEMEYVSMVLNETLRRHPSNPLLKRKLKVKYQVEGTKIYIPKNTRIVIPVSSIHHNEEYYPDPLTFNPERFSEEEVKKRHLMTFLPFKESLTSSIDEKFALCSAKIALILVLKNFKISSMENRGNNSSEYKKNDIKFVSLK